MSKFYWRLLVRQTHLRQTRIFLFSMVVIASALFASNFVNNRLEHFFTLQSKKILASDLVLQSSIPLTKEQASLVDNAPLEKAKTLTFRTMASTVDNFLLVSIKAVSEYYPLRGELQITNTEAGKAQAIKKGPNDGEVWVEARVLQALDLTVGDRLSIGEQNFLISAILLLEPDRSGSVYSFTPRIMMRLDNIKQTNILQPGSRFKYRYLFAGKQASLAALEKKLSPSLLVSQEFIGVADISDYFQDILRQTQSVFHISTLLSLLLGILGVGLASYQYHKRVAVDMGILRCMGFSAVQLRFILFLSLGSLVIIACLLGGFLGWLLQKWVFFQLSDFILTKLPTPGIQTFLLVPLMIFGVVTVSSGPLFIQVSHGSTKMLLNSSGSGKVFRFELLLIMVLGTLGLVFLSSGNLAWSASASVLFFLLAGLFYGLLHLVFCFINRMCLYNPYLRLGIRFLSANRRLIGLQIIVISLTLFVISLMAFLKSDLLNAWDQKVPVDAPNFFAINLSASDHQTLAQILTEKNILHSPFYPIVRGRLSGINGQPIREYVSKESSREHEALHRDLSLSVSDLLPTDNQIIVGAWHAGISDIFAQVSVEAELAKKLHLAVGDNLEFTVATRMLNAKITSLRTVKWESFYPNFYMLFAPRDLLGFPMTYLVSLFIKPEQKKELFKLIRRFPNATFLDIDLILKQLRIVIRQASNAIQILLYLAIFSSLVVFLCVEWLLQYNRLKYVALLKALGGDIKLIQKIFSLQFLLVGSFAGLFAYLAYLTVGMILASLLEIPFVFNIFPLFVCLFVAPVSICFLAHIILYNHKDKSVTSLWGRANGVE